MGETRETRQSLGLAYTAKPSTSSAATGNKSHPLSRPFSKSPGSGTFGCKIVYATMKRTPKGVSFTETNQTYITLKEETANVSYIKEKTRERFGCDVTLVAGNGLPIQDEEGTRGEFSSLIYVVENGHH
jgi:hypothetical protein